MTDLIFTEKNGRLCDQFNNSYHMANGVDAAKAALGSLTNCANCIDCTDCTDCTECAYCTECTDCTGKVGVKGGKSFGEVPIIPNLHSIAYKNAIKDGCFDMGDWACGSKMCRAGHLVNAAGKAGYDLKDATSWEFAAKMLAKANGLPVSPTKFFAPETNETALADMKRYAEMEAERASQ